MIVCLLRYLLLNCRGVWVPSASHGADPWRISWWGWCSHLRLWPHVPPFHRRPWDELHCPCHGLCLLCWQQPEALWWEKATSTMQCTQGCYCQWAIDTSLDHCGFAQVVWRTVILHLTWPYSNPCIVMHVVMHYVR